MKNKLVLLLTICILLLLAGCVAEANPGVIPQPAESTQNTESSGLENTHTTQLVELPSWEDHPFLSLIAEPQDSWSVVADEPSYVQVSLEDMDMDKYNTLVEQLRNAGFTIDSCQWKVNYWEHTEYYLMARDAFGNTVYLTASDKTMVVEDGFQVAKDGWECSFLLCNYYLEKEATLEPPVSAEKQTEPWDSHPLRALVPAPPTEYWIGKDEATHHYVRLEYVSYEQLKEYVEALQGAGFIYYESNSRIPFGDQIRFCARNEAGYTVYLTKLEVTTSGLHAPALLIYAPDSAVQLTAWESLGAGMILPEPPIEDYKCEENSYGATYSFKGMDYWEALAYMEEIKKSLTDQGTDNHLADAVLEQNDAVERFFFQVVVISNSTSRDVVLTYDASQGEYACVLEVRMPGCEPMD